MLLDPRALPANLIGLLDQAALLSVLHARPWPAVPLDHTPLLAAAALVVADQCAWAWLIVPRGIGRGAAAARLPRLVAILAAFVWPVPAGVVLTLAVAADPLPVSSKSPAASPRASWDAAPAAAGAPGGAGAAAGQGRLQQRRLGGGRLEDARAALAAVHGAREDGWDGGSKLSHAIGAVRVRQVQTQGRLLRLIRQWGERVGLRLEPEGLPVRAGGRE